MLDLGEWWLLETGLPLPLGVNVVRRDVPRLGELSEVLRESINAGLEHREDATRTRSGSRATSTPRPQTSSSTCTSTS